MIALHWYRFKASVFPLIATVSIQLFVSFITTWLKKKKQITVNKKAQHNQFIRQLLVKYLFVYPLNYTYLLRILNSRLRSTITINIVTIFGPLGPWGPSQPLYNVSTEDKQTTKDTCLYIYIYIWEIKHKQSCMRDQPHTGDIPPSARRETRKKVGQGTTTNQCRPWILTFFYPWMDTTGTTPSIF